MLITYIYHSDNHSHASLSYHPPCTVPALCSTPGKSTLSPCDLSWRWKPLCLLLKVPSLPVDTFLHVRLFPYAVAAGAVELIQGDLLQSSVEGVGILVLTNQCWDGALMVGGSHAQVKASCSSSLRHCTHAVTALSYQTFSVQPIAALHSVTTMAPTPTKHTCSMVS